MATESVTVSIPDAIIDDYLRRGVFSEVAAMKVDTKYASPVRCSSYVISRKLAYRMYDDALDRRLNRSPQVDRKLFTEYGRLKNFINHSVNILAMGRLAWEPGHAVRKRAWKDAQDAVIYLLFYPLGIKAAETEATP